MPDQTHQRAVRNVSPIALRQDILVPENKFIKLVVDGIGCNFVASDLHSRTIQQDPV